MILVYYIYNFPITRVICCAIPRFCYKWLFIYVSQILSLTFWWQSESFWYQCPLNNYSSKTAGDKAVIFYFQYFLIFIWIFRSNAVLSISQLFVMNRLPIWLQKFFNRTKSYITTTSIDRFSLRMWSAILLV